MTNLDLEAIKARAKGLEAAMDNDVADYDPGAWEMCVDLQDLVAEVERLKEQVESAYKLGGLIELGEILESDRQASRQAPLAQAITNDMIDRAADAIYRELSGKYGDFGYPETAARAALEAALGDDE